MTAAYIVLDEVLERLAAYGPDLRNGLTNHAPMAVEALCAMGRPDAVRPWVERSMRPRDEQIDSTLLEQRDHYGSS